MRITRTITLILVSLSLILISLTSAADKNSDIVFPLSQVKPGLKGKVYTVFKGTKPTEYEGEVLGVLQSAIGPKRDLILVQLHGKDIEFTDAFHGMSGSPFFINSKLAGAISFRIGSFSKEVIAGCTPAEYILNLSNPLPEIKARQLIPSSNSPTKRFFKDIKLNHPFLIDLFDKSEIERGIISNAPLENLNFPLHVGGFNKLSSTRIKKVFGDFGFSVIETGFLQSTNTSALSSSEVREAHDAWTQTQKNNEPGSRKPSTKLVPGSAISIPLMVGDFNISASGTVTYVDDEKIFAFGHPFLQLGSVKWPIYSARVMKVFPSALQPFHMVSMEEEKGVLLQDGLTGIYGQLGEKAEMIPVDVIVRNSGALVSKYQSKLINDRSLTPILYWIFSEAAMLNNMPSSPPSSIEMRTLIELKDDYGTIVAKDIFSGSSTIRDATMLSPALVWMLMNNEFKDVRINRLQVALDYHTKQKTAEIIRVRYDKDTVSPGDNISLKIYLRTWRGQTIVKNTRLKIPKTFPEGTFKIVIGDATYITRLENKNLGIKPRFRDLEHLIGIMNSLKPSNTIYIQMLKISEGVYTEGRFLSDLPPSYMELLTSKRTDNDIIPFRISVMSEDRISTDYKVTGKQEVILKIKKTIKNHSREKK